MYESQYLPLISGLAQAGPNQICLLSLAAGSDAATLSIYDGQGGLLIWTLKAAAGTTAIAPFAIPLSIKEGIFVALTGTSPLAYAAVDNAVIALRTSSSISPSLSPSASLSPSHSVSPSSSASISPSSSVSPSSSPSDSPSSSISPSSSPSASPSSSNSPSNSPSASPSSSASPSNSESSSISASVSPSI